MAEECRLPAPEATMRFLESESRLAILTLDLKGTILASNGGMERLFGLPASRGGGSILEFILPENVPLVLGIIESILSIPGGLAVSFRKETVNFRFSGSAVHTMACFFSRHGESVALIAEPRRMSDSEVIIGMTDLNNELAGLSRELTRRNVELEKAGQTINRLLNTDVLTGIPNRRALEKFLSERCCQEAEQPFSLIMADIDHFKKVNDTFGHHAGDVVLAAFGNLLSDQTRERDMAGRFGGEEFIVAMPGTSMEEAAAVAERIRESTEKLLIGDPPVTVTASFGAVSLREGEDWESLVRRGDEAMYRAKKSGRNRVVADL